MSNSDIDNHFVGEVKYGGVYMNDSFCKTVPHDTGMFYILNLQNSNENGSHWVLISCMKKEIVYFDPYGFPATKDVTNWILKSKRPNRYSQIDIQDLYSHACGWYCIYFSKRLLDGWTPNEIVAELSKGGEIVLQNYFSS
jgi:hypothetical protein